METGTKQIGLLLALIVVGAVGLVYVSGRGSTPRMKCGHMDDSSLFSWVSGPQHHCQGQRLLNDLYVTKLAQGMFRTDFNRTATNLTELLPYMPGVQPKDYVFSYKAEGDRWSVSVGKTNKLPGYYLLSMEGLFFNEQHPATTNDLCLATMKTD